jgi:hypothetical protein
LADPVSAMIQRASDALGALSADETELLDNALQGRRTDFIGRPPPKIRADVIRWICTDPDSTARLQPLGLRVRGAQIDGDLDLNGVRLESTLVLNSCVMGQLIARDARLRTVVLDGTVSRGFIADRVEISGSLLMRAITDHPARTCEVHGQLVLLKASISGDLDCTGALISAPGLVAVIMQRARVGGSVFLRGGNKGIPPHERRMVGPGQPPGTALDRLPIFHCQGAIELRDAEIGGALDCSGARLSDCPIGQAGYPYSLDAARATMASAYLTRQFAPDGLVVLSGASVKGVLNFARASLGSGGLIGDGLSVGQTLWWTNVDLDASASRTVLAFADLGTLHFDMKSWPAPGRVSLTGATYRDLNRWLTPRDRERGTVHADVAAFLEIIRLQTTALPQDDSPGYSGQPYEQLATVLKRGGEERAAQRVLIARVDDALKRRNQFVRAAGLMLKATIGYGYRPLRVVAYLAGMLLLGTIAFSVGYHHHDFGSTNPVHPPFAGLTYSLDALLPFIDLGQEKAWTVKTGGVTWVAIYYWIHVCMGWLLSSFVVVGLTRAAR